MPRLGYDQGAAPHRSGRLTAMALTPFLMFTGRAEEAMDFYVATFPDAEVLEIDRYGAEEPDREGTVITASFRIGEQRLRCIDSPPVHAFDFTPAVSFAFDCDDEAQLDGLFAKLSDGGAVLMPADAYPFAKRYAWVNDRFGVSWQLRLAL